MGKATQSKGTQGKGRDSKAKQAKARAKQGKARESKRQQDSKARPAKARAQKGKAKESKGQQLNTRENKGKQGTARDSKAREARENKVKQGAARQSKQKHGQSKGQQGKASKNKGKQGTARQSKLKHGQSKGQQGKASENKGKQGTARQSKLKRGQSKAKQRKARESKEMGKQRKGKARQRKGKSKVKRRKARESKGKQGKAIACRGRRFPLFAGLVCRKKGAKLKMVFLLLRGLVDCLLCMEAKDLESTKFLKEAHLRGWLLPVKEGSSTQHPNFQHKLPRFAFVGSVVTIEWIPSWHFSKLGNIGQYSAELNKTRQAQMAMRCIHFATPEKAPLATLPCCCFLAALTHQARAQGRRLPFADAS